MDSGRFRLRSASGLVLVGLVVLIGGCSSAVEDVSTTSGSNTPAPAADEVVDDGVSSYEDPPAEEAPPATEAGPGAPRQQAADVNELLDAWGQQGLSDYSYSADIFVLTWSEDGQPPEVANECGSSGGTVAVRVAESAAVEAQVPESACVIDLASPTRVPLTAEELFAKTVELMDDDFFGARGVIEFSLRSFEEGSGSTTLASDEAARLKRARARWAGAQPESYLIEVDRVCRCAPPYRGRFEVRVDGDATTATVDGAVLPDDLDAASFSVDGLYDAIEGWADADLLQVAYDEEWGIPFRINVDPASGTADDEVTLEVTRFLSDPDPQVDLAMLLGDVGAAVDDAPDDAITLGDATFCGFDDVSLNDEPIGGDPISRACFTSRADRGEPAVVVRRSPTAEGDPIFAVFRSNADGSLRVHTDTSQDAFGGDGRGWQTAACSGVEDRSDVGPNFFYLRCP